MGERDETPFGTGTASDMHARTGPRTPAKENRPIISILILFWWPGKLAYLPLREIPGGRVGFVKLVAGRAVGWPCGRSWECAAAWELG